jgi:hypothetical protein
MLIRARIEPSASNTTTMTVSLPISAAGPHPEQAVRAMDNGSWLSAPASATIAAYGSTVATMYKDFAGSAWTNTTNKALIAQFLEWF